MKRIQLGDVVIWQFTHLTAQEGVVHGITTRHGGESAAPYASLNLGLHVGDDPHAVVTNRQRVCKALGLDFTRLTLGAQVHGASLAEVNETNIGAGRDDLTASISEVDGVVVRLPNTPIAVLSADCVPLLMYDTRQHLAAAVHAGWRGTEARMAYQAVQFLREQCGSRPEDLLVGIGPSIGPCCYQVSERVAGLLNNCFAYMEPVARETPNGWYADLPSANWQQLVAADVPAERIERSGICTSCHSDEFFSERKLGRPTGRLVAVISLR